MPRILSWRPVLAPLLASALLLSMIVLLLRPALRAPSPQPAPQAAATPSPPRPDAAPAFKKKYSLQRVAPPRSDLARPQEPAP